MNSKAIFTMYIKEKLIKIGRMSNIFHTLYEVLIPLHSGNTDYNLLQQEIINFCIKCITVHPLHCWNDNRQFT